ncbi:hypothetical protein AB0O64_23950 [Streptomyces sp. NPDC088341]|uniref:hypothetical protein n=1 Tax=Streptomyces sp. NPDC088341 TaxID=3154870 RepID=UPI00343FCDEA
MADAIGAPRTERAYTPHNPTPGSSGLGTTTSPSPEDLALSMARQTNRRLELDRIAALKADSPGMTDAEAYRRLFESAIGPRFEGTVYRDAAGTWEVLELLFGDEAREKQSYTSWLLVERSVFDHSPREHRFGWTANDQVIYQPAEREPSEFAAVAASALVANGLTGSVVSA